MNGVSVVTVLAPGSQQRRRSGVVSIFQDNFNDNSISGVNWPNLINTNTELVEQNARLEFANATTTAYSDPSIYSGDVGRTAAAMLDFDVYFVEATTEHVIGFFDGTGVAPASDLVHIMWFYSDGNVYCREAGIEGAATTYAGATWYYCRITLKATGATYFMDTTAAGRGGTQIADLAVNANAVLHIGMGNANEGDFYVDNVDYHE